MMVVQVVESSIIVESHSLKEEMLYEKVST